MAKKTVASLQKGEGRTYSKVIKMEISENGRLYLQRGDGSQRCRAGSPQVKKAQMQL